MKDQFVCPLESACFSSGLTCFPKNAGGDAQNKEMLPNAGSDAQNQEMLPIRQKLFS